MAIDTDPVLAYIAQNPGADMREIRGAVEMDESGIYRAIRDLRSRGSIFTKPIKPVGAGRPRMACYPISAASAPPQMLIAPPAEKAKPATPSRFHVRTVIDVKIGGSVVAMTPDEIRDLVADLSVLLLSLPA